MRGRTVVRHCFREWILLFVELWTRCVALPPAVPPGYGYVYASIDEN